MPYNLGIDARKLADFGIGTYIRNLVGALAEIDEENRYVLFVGGRYDGSFDELPENFRVVTERSPVYSVRELLALSWRLLRLRLDLYHATHYVLPAVVPCKAVVTIHDIIHLLYPEFLPSRLAFLYAQRMIRRSLLRGHRIIADSQNTKTDLMDYFDVDGRKIEHIYPGVANRFFQAVPRREIEHWSNELGITAPYALFVGNPKPHKNLDNVIKAFAHSLQLAHTSCNLVVVGAREDQEMRIRKRTEQLDIADRVRIVGHVEEHALPAIYQGAALFLYPTLYEGFGLPVVEAMASGVPVITSANSALREVAEGYAELVNPLDIDQMAGAIQRVLRDEEHRRRLVERGRRRARDFSWRRTAEQTLAVYDSVLTANGRGGRRATAQAPRA